MKKVTGEKRKKSPSREKYEAENPTVSARVPKGTRDKLRVNLAKSGMSLADGLRFLAGELELKVKPVDEARQAGYEEARNRYMVTYLCNVCGKPIPIVNPKTKEVASRCMTARGWGHTKCHERTHRP